MTMLHLATRGVYVSVFSLWCGYGKGQMEERRGGKKWARPSLGLEGIVS
jgi:hypothetical protein